MRNNIIDVGGEKCISFLIGDVGSGAETELEATPRGESYQFRLLLDWTEFLNGIHSTIRLWGPGPKTPMGKGIRDSLKAVQVADRKSEHKSLVPISADPARITFRPHYTEVLITVRGFQSCVIDYLREHPVVSMGGYDRNYRLEMEKRLRVFVNQAA
ncbi:MAG: hypothetical protein Q8P88_00325 [Candidatus Jorgensenbacteria bacterium]|nr:hypothetical protein [Candidatus Jorgensenbacteria bacterium]